MKYLSNQLAVVGLLLSWRSGGPRRTGINVEVRNTAKIDKASEPEHC